MPPSNFAQQLARTRSIMAHAIYDAVFRAFYGEDFIATELATPKQDKAGCDAIVFHRWGRAHVQAKFAWEREPKNLWLEDTNARGEEGWLWRYNQAHADFLLIIYVKHGVAALISIHDLPTLQLYADRHEEELEADKVRFNSAPTELVSLPLKAALYICNGIKVINFPAPREELLMLFPGIVEKQSDLFLERT